MSRLATLDHFIFTSDFPADMITYFTTDNFTVPAGGSGTRTYSHALGYIPLCFGVWATQPDFSDSRPISDGFFTMTVRATMTQVKLQYSFYDATTATNVYVRIYGFPPSTYTGECPATAQSSTPLILNTDESYSPLIFEGAFATKRNEDPSTMKELVVSITENYQKLIDTGNYLTIYHSLPYRPRVMLWGEKEGDCVLSAAAEFDYWGGMATNTYPNCWYGDNYISVDLGMGYPSEPEIKTHIRIYA